MHMSYGQGTCRRMRKWHSYPTRKSDFNSCLLGARIGETDEAIRIPGRWRGSNEQKAGKDYLCHWVQSQQWLSQTFHPNESTEQLLVQQSRLIRKHIEVTVQRHKSKEKKDEGKAGREDSQEFRHPFLQQLLDSSFQSCTAFAND